MQLRTIGSGSDGNCYLFNDNLMLDLGVSFNTIKSYVKNIKFLLLTHIHKDHFNITSIRKLFVKNEELKIVCCEWIYEELLKIGFDKNRLLHVEIGKVYALSDYKISPFLLYHDVDNCGYRIMYKGHKHIHATDTSHLEGITALNYDSATIECNHCEIRALELIQKAQEKGEFSHLKGAMNSHLSVQQAVNFIKENNIKKLIPCHVGNSTKKEVEEYLGENTNQAI